MRRPWPTWGCHAKNKTMTKAKSVLVNLDTICFTRNTVNYISVD